MLGQMDGSRYRLMPPTAGDNNEVFDVFVGLQDDAVQFFKEEIEEGVAVYNVYLKKVHYHTSINEVSYSATSCSDATGVQTN